MVFVDVGANLGQYTLYAAERVGPTGQVHSFEPHPRMFAELQHNVRLNKLENICRLNNFALSDMNGSSDFVCYQPGKEVYGSFGAHGRSAEHVTGTIRVDTVRLDDYIERNSIERVHLLKMDIEGAELLALRGAQQLLRGLQAPTLTVEICQDNTRGCGYDAVEIIDFLQSCGYHSHAIDACGRVSREESRINTPGSNLAFLKDPIGSPTFGTLVCGQ